MNKIEIKCPYCGYDLTRPESMYRDIKTESDYLHFNNGVLEITSKSKYGNYLIGDIYCYKCNRNIHENLASLYDEGIIDDKADAF